MLQLCWSAKLRNKKDTSFCAQKKLSKFKHEGSMILNTEINFAYRFINIKLNN